MSKDNKPLVKNAADANQVENAKQKERSRREQELNDVRWVLSDRRGRRWFWAKLNECGVFKTSFDGSSRTYFNEGERNVGLKLLADVNDADPKAYVTMLLESRGEES
jgi:hypothetical protein